MNSNTNINMESVNPECKNCNWGCHCTQEDMEENTALCNCKFYEPLNEDEDLENSLYQDRQSYNKDWLEYINDDDWN